MDGPQALGLHTQPKAQGLQGRQGKEEQQQCELRHRRIIGHCPFGHHHPQQSLHGSLGHVCGHERRRVMVCTSVHMGHIVSMRGWATRHGTRHLNLPIFLIHQLPTNLHCDPISPRLPYQGFGNSDRQIGSLAAPGGNLAPFAAQESRDTRFL